MTAGWTGAYLDVDLTAGSIEVRETLPLARDYIGGRAMASRIGWDEIPAGIDAFDPRNVIIVAAGPLTGTLAPTSGRTLMAGLSPRSYPRPWYTHSTLGGWFGPQLKYAGFDAIVVRGAADSPTCLVVRDGHARLEDATDLWGLDARETQLVLKARAGQRSQALVIGPAGESLVRFATVQHAEENAAGHSGFGAVWGSKRLKAIVVKGTRGVAVADPDALLREVLGAGVFSVAPSSSVAGQVPGDDDPSPRPICSQSCTFDCNLGAYRRASDGRRVPAFCVGRIWDSSGGMAWTQYSGGGVEVPPGWNFGTAEEISLHELCNALGLDLWFRLVMQPWFIRCKQLGIHEIRGYPIEPENRAWFEQFTHQLAQRDGLGDIFAEDLRRAMDELEGELPDELFRLGHELEFGFGFPAHRDGRFWDAEPLPFWVISAMMVASTTRDPTIGTHQSSLLLADLLLEEPEVARRQFRILSEKVWGYADALEPTFEGKAPVAIWSQHQHVLIDSLPLCDFAFPQLVRPMGSREEWLNAEDVTGDLDIDRRLLSAVTGVAFTREQLDRVAERGFTLERAMLARAGRGRGLEQALGAHFRLPCRDDGTWIDEPGFSRLLDEYYAARGWDLVFGWPQAGALDALGLKGLVPQMEALRRRGDWAASDLGASR